MGPYVLGLRETSRKITSPSILFPLRCILFPSVYLQLWFCSVISTCIFEAILWSHPSHRAETELLWNFGVSTCSICKVILKFSSVTLRLQCPCWKPTTYHRFVDILSRYALLWWLVPEKIAFCLQHSGTKYRYFIWAKRSTAYCAAMVHSARCIALLLAPFDFTLPSEREKPSRIDWKIEISPHTRWVLLYLFPARMSHFRASHHATCCARRSLTSCRPVMHMCSYLGARVRCHDMPRGTARAPPQVPQHFDGAWANESLFGPPVDLFSFTWYGAD